MEYRKGESMHFRGKYGMIYDITVIKDEGETVYVKKNNGERLHVLKRKILRVLPESEIKFREKVNEELAKADEILRKIKDGEEEELL